VKAAGEGRLLPRLTREPRLSDKVADLLLETIVREGFRAGDRLPSERELGEQLGVSRTVVREAVRSLAAKGVIEARTGSGLRVAEVDSTAVSESMRLYVYGRGELDYPMVHEVRTMVEVHVAGLAAERADDEDIARMRDSCEQMASVLDNVEHASRADVEFHRAVAESTHNQLFVVMLDSIVGLLLDIRRETIGLPRRADQALADHRAILQQIASHEATGAREAMRAHLEFVLRAWEETRQGSVQ
jgi:GntR family transcriptional regulator, transcriptional repressor for pyruvate dehydrogenase complex